MQFVQSNLIETGGRTDGIAISVVDVGEGEMMLKGEGGTVAMDNIILAVIPC